MKKKVDENFGRPGELAFMQGAVNRGYCYERTQHGPLEAAFAKLWEEENEERPGINYGNGTLQDLFMDNSGSMMFARCIHQVTDSERYVAATVVQWMGTNCGMSFLETALRHAGYTIRRLEGPPQPIPEKPQTRMRKFDFEV